MLFRLHNHGLMTDAVRDLTERKSRLLERRLAHVKEDLKSLDVAITRRHRDGVYIAKLVLSIPDRILAASGEGPDTASALGAAFDALADRLDKAMAKMGRVPLIRRQQLAYRLPSAQLARAEAEIERMEGEEEVAEELTELAEESAAEGTTPPTPRPTA